MRANLVVVAGNLVRDPELKYTQSGKAICKLGIAINNSFINANGEQKKDTVFVDVDIWGKQAEASNKYLTKGVPVYVEGRLKQDNWTTPDGAKRSKLKVTATKVQFLNYRTTEQTPKEEKPEVSDAAIDTEMDNVENLNLDA